MPNGQELKPRKGPWWLYFFNPATIPVGLYEAFRDPTMKERLAPYRELAELSGRPQVLPEELAQLFGQPTILPEVMSEAMQRLAVERQDPGRRLLDIQAGLSVLGAFPPGERALAARSFQIPLPQQTIGAEQFPTLKPPAVFGRRVGEQRQPVRGTIPITRPIVPRTREELPEEIARTRAQEDVQTAYVETLRRESEKRAAETQARIAKLARGEDVLNLLKLHEQMSKKLSVSDRDRARMRAIEDTILQRLGLAEVEKTEGAKEKGAKEDKDESFLSRIIKGILKANKKAAQERSEMKQKIQPKTQQETSFEKLKRLIKESQQ